MRALPLTLLLLIASTAALSAQPEYLDPRTPAALETAAAGGDVQAMTVLGWRLDYGVGVAQSDDAALRWYRRAGEHPRALLRRAWFWKRRPAKAPDLAQIPALERRAALAGDALAMWSLGNSLRQGLAPHDPGGPLTWTLRAAESGCAAAMIGIALLTRVDPRLPSWPADRAAARGWIEAARRRVEQADPPPELADLHRVAEALRTGLGVMPADPRGALVYARRAADAGDTDALTLVGNLWHHHLTRNDRHGDALPFYRRAAARNNLWAIYELAYIDGNGQQGRPLNRAAAAHGYRRALAGGSLTAMRYLRLPPAEARPLLERRAQLGDPEAMGTLGRAWRREGEGGGGAAVHWLIRSVTHAGPTWVTGELEQAAVLGSPIAREWFTRQGRAASLAVAPLRVERGVRVDGLRAAHELAAHVPSSRRRVIAPRLLAELATRLELAPGGIQAAVPDSAEIQALRHQVDWLLRGEVDRTPGGALRLRVELIDVRKARVTGRAEAPLTTVPAAAAAVCARLFPAAAAPPAAPLWSSQSALFYPWSLETGMVMITRHDPRVGPLFTRRLPFAVAPPER